MALLLVALGFRSSMDNVIEVQYEDIRKFDLKINLTQMLDVDELNYIRSLDHVVSVEPVMETGMEITNGWKKKDIGVIAL
jgi:putative ABC transport system permease protein